jgi:hypothetical protein
MTFHDTKIEWKQSSSVEIIKAIRNIMCTKSSRIPYPLLIYVEAPLLPSKKQNTIYTCLAQKVTNGWLTLRYVLLAVARQKSEPWNYKTYNMQISFITSYGIDTQFTYFQTMDSMPEKTI